MHPSLTWLGGPHPQLNNHKVPGQSEVGLFVCRVSLSSLVKYKKYDDNFNISILLKTWNAKSWNEFLIKVSIVVQCTFIISLYLLDWVRLDRETRELLCRAKYSDLVPGVDFWGVKWTKLGDKLGRSPGPGLEFFPGVVHQTLNVEPFFSLRDGVRGLWEKLSAMRGSGAEKTEVWLGSSDCWLGRDVVPPVTPPNSQTAWLLLLGYPSAATGTAG